MEKYIYTTRVYDSSSLNDDEIIEVFDEYVEKLRETLEASRGKFLSNMGRIAALSLQLHLILEEMNKRQPDTVILANNYLNLEDILDNLNIKRNDKD